MPLFHPQILQKITSPSLEIPKEHAEILAAWAGSIEDNTIQRQKETALAGLFREKIVTGILGYQPFGSHAYDVHTEFPIAGGNVDLALGAFEPNDETQSQCIAPFELKGAKTKLDVIMPGRNKTPVQQAWDYAMDAKGAKWVLVSNYLEIRLYAVGYGRQDFESFDLAKLTTPAEYTRFYRLLSKESLLGGKTKAWLDESAKQDKSITASLYQDYKNLRLQLIRDIRKHNPALEIPVSVSCAQTLLDRALFIAFAEDKELLPDNTLKKACDYKDPYHPRPVWDTFKALFSSINQGNPALKIPKYNGGLFAEDEGVNALILPDSVFEGIKKLGEYDFNTEISVTILGHIFEQSISDLEALLSGSFDTAPKKDGKRKKEGVVYTPDFITRFIVEQTLGGYLKQKKQAFHNSRAKDLISKGDRKGEFRDDEAEIAYWRAWQDTLKTVKVVDPACGSGAFLVAAFDYLYDEYKLANDRITELRGGTADYFDPDREILTNNLFGVDINSESIEITKLSLWLKTAKHGKELNSLDDNFQWGDSLIEDSSFSARAFTWKDAFPAIFKNGGFDVVLGNPPYVRQEFISHLKPYLEKRFEVYDGTIDLYAYFFELGLRMLKDGGRMGYISSATFFKTGSGQNLRAYLKQNAALETIVDFGDLQVFEGVTTYPAILTMQKGKAGKDHALAFGKVTKLPDNLSQWMQTEGKALAQSALYDDGWQLEGVDLQVLREKIKKKSKTLKEVYGAPLNGIKTGYNDAFVIDATTRDRLVKEDAKTSELIKPFLEGKDVQKWRVEGRKLSVILIPKGFTKSRCAQTHEDAAWTWLKKSYPAVAGHLEKHVELARKRGDKGDFWWELRACDYYSKFEEPKIIYAHFQNEPLYSYESKNLFLNNKCYIFPNTGYYELGLLNSKAMWFIFKGMTTMVRGGYYEATTQNIQDFPIPLPPPSITKKKIGDIAEACQKAAEDRYALQEQVRRRICDLASASWNKKLGNRLTDWWTLDFKAFQAEVKKVFKRDIPIMERDGWDKYLSTNRQQVDALTQKIAALEADLNKEVYALFKLTPDEIRLVEESI